MKNILNIKKSAMYILMAIVMFLGICVPSFANEVSTLEEPPGVTTPFDEIVGDTLPKDVSLSKVSGWIDRKAEDIFMIMQKVIRWICIICFIAFLGKGIFGLFGRGDMLPQALVGCTWSVVVYSIVTYAPQLLELGKNWFLSGLF